MNKLSDRALYSGAALRHGRVVNGTTFDSVKEVAFVVKIAFTPSAQSLFIVWTCCLSNCFLFVFELGFPTLIVLNCLKFDGEFVGLSQHVFMEIV